ncbi:hypothetical protein KW803_00540 [Candidatus Saccharibacteria bacterium]|nr:hypothetical protein [Candidatus Saccharibacteria bacterium]
MAQIQSQSEKTIHHSRNFLKPSWAQVLLYLLLSIILLVLLNVGDVIHRFGGTYISTPESLKTNFTTLSTGFSNSFSNALGGRLGQIMLWSFIGAVAYIGLWLAKNVLNSFENDIISAHYLHPKGYSRAGYWGSSLAVKVFLASMIFITVGYFFVSIRAVLPALAALAGSAAYNFELQNSVLYILFSIVGGALVLYIGVMLLRVVSHLWKML